MHESKGHHIGKAPSLHLFHTTADAMLLDHISLAPEHVGEGKWLGTRLKPCHHVLHYHMSAVYSTHCFEEVPYNIMLPRGSY